MIMNLLTKFEMSQLKIIQVMKRKLIYGGLPADTAKIYPWENIKCVYRHHLRIVYFTA